MSNDGPAEDDWIGIGERGANLILKLWAEVEKLRAEVERLVRERDEARAEVVLLKKGTHQSPALPYQPVGGCMCPAGASLSCQSSFCPRRNPPAV